MIEMINKIENQFAGEDEPNIRYTFKISYNATKENKQTHADFKELSKEFDSCYIATLRNLLDTYEQSWNHDNIYMQLEVLRDRVTAMELLLQDMVEEPKEEESKKEKKGLRTFADKKEE